MESDKPPTPAEPGATSPISAAEGRVSQDDWLTCIGPGWRPIVAALIQRANDEKVDIHQVKEKFGGLRFYTGPASRHMYALIDAAELLSNHLCEECGQLGKHVSLGGWIKTRCPEHTPNEPRTTSK